MVNPIKRWTQASAGVLVLWSLGGCWFESVPEGMVLVPAGEFIMGTNETDSDNHALRLGLRKPWYADETPERKIYLEAFYIDKYEVTNRQYYIFSQATDHKPPSSWGGQKYPEGTGDLPVTDVHYFDATAYAEWAGKRLPSEAEWEKAARGPYGHRYPWGNEFSPTAANLSLSRRKLKSGKLRPVGSFPEGMSFYGIYDMVGNAWEWVRDYYRPYNGSKYQTGDYDKKDVVVRGMSYLGVGHFPENEYRKVVALQARASYREHLPILARKKDVGFRCAMDRPPLMERLFGKRSKD